MIKLLTNRVALVWLLITAIISAAAALIWLSIVSGDPRSNSVVIYAADPPTPLAQAAETPTSRSASSRGSTVEKTQPGPTLPAATEPEQPVATATPGSIAVYVSGGVHQPGVYSLTEGSRVSEAIAAAGGPAENADLERINLAARLADAQHLAVPRIGETPPAVLPDPAQQPTVPGPAPAKQATAPPQEAAREPAAKVNINTAGTGELETLPGIGPALAARILEYRQANGPFAAIEDVMLIPGIKTGLFAKIKDHITVGGE